MSNGYYISPENEHKIRKLINEYAPRPYPTKPVPNPSRNDDRYYVVCGAAQDAYPMYLGTIQVFDSFNRSWTSMTANDVYLIDSRARDLTPLRRYKCDLMGLHNGKGLFMTDDGGVTLDRIVYHCEDGTELCADVSVEDGEIVTWEDYESCASNIPPPGGGSGSVSFTGGWYFASYADWMQTLNQNELEIVILSGAEEYEKRRLNSE